MFTVALIGPDGAGKTTISSRLEAELGVPVKSIYMGVNLHSSSVMLPHTRLLLDLRRRRRGAGSSDLSDIKTEKAPPRTAAGRAGAATRAALRLTNWLAEEWYRQAVSAYHTRRGTIVIFDRHFFADYYSEEVGNEVEGRPLSRRIHGFFLRHLYPRPDLVICLDAPAEVLFARKPEGSMERLRKKREEYLELQSAVPESVVVDAGMPADEVTREVAAIIRAYYEQKRATRPSRLWFTSRSDRLGDADRARRRAE